MAYFHGKQVLTCLFISICLTCINGEDALKGLDALRSLASKESPSGFRFAELSGHPANTNPTKSRTILEEWRRSHSKRSSGDNDAAFLEVSGDDSKLTETYDLATQILRESYGLDTVDGPNEGDSPRFADSQHTVAANVEAEEQIQAETVQKGDNKDIFKNLASSALKVGAKATQKFEEFQAAKEAAKGTTEECVMCIYTLEMMKKFLTPAQSAQSNSLLSGELGQRGQFIGSSRGARVPVEFPKASAYKGKLPQQERQRSDQALPKEEPVKPLEMPTVDSVDSVVDGDQRTPVDADGLTPDKNVARFRQLLDNGVHSLEDTVQQYHAARGKLTNHPAAPPLVPPIAGVDETAPIAGGEAALPPLRMPWGEEATNNFLEVAEGFAAHGFLTYDADNLPDHLNGAWYQSHPAYDQMKANTPEAVKALHNMYTAVAGMADEAEAHPDVSAFLETVPSSDEAVREWMADSGHVIGSFHGSAFHPADAVKDTLLLETDTADSEGPASLDSFRTGTALDGRADAALGSVPFRATGAVPPVGENDEATTDVSNAKQPLDGMLYRDFAGEDAVFGNHPVDPEMYISDSLEAGAVSPMMKGGSATQRSSQPADATPAGNGKDAESANDGISGGTVMSGSWSHGGDVSTHSRGSSGLATEDVWFGKQSYVAPGTTTRKEGKLTSFMPSNANPVEVRAAEHASTMMGEADGFGNKAAERIFYHEGLRGVPGFDAAMFPQAAPETGKKAPNSFIELQNEDQFIGGLVNSVKNAVGKVVDSAMFPLPHSCGKDSLCPQRMRQPSVYHLYRLKRRDEQRAAMNRALLSYSMALDMLCERDEAGLDAEEPRSSPVLEQQMAGYPNLQAETHRRFGYLDDQWSFMTEATEHGDRVGVGSLHRYALPDPFRTYCPKIRAKLAIVAERLLHGYDEEEVCYALKMCPYEMVQVWRPGPPTTAMGNVMGTLGVSGKVQEDQRV